MDYKDKIISIIPFVLITLAVYVILYIVFLETNGVFELLMWLTPTFFAITFLLIVFSFFWSAKDLWKLFKKIDKKTWIALLIVFIVGLSLRTFVAPHTHRLYYDDDIYLNIAQNIARDGKAYYCQYGTQEQCFSYIYNKQPNGYSFLVSIPFFLFGVSENTAHYFTAIVSSLTIIIVFLIAYLLFKNEKIGIFSSLVFIFIPITIRWAPTTSQGPIFLFFSALTVLAFLCYFKTEKNKILLFSFTLLAYTIQMRTEGFLLILLIALMFFLLKKDLFKKVKKKESMVIFVCFSILILLLSIIEIMTANLLTFDILSAIKYLLNSPNFLIIVLLVFLFFSFTISMYDKISKKEVLIILVCFSLLIVPHIIHMSSVKGQSWGTEGEKLSIEYIDENLQDNTMFFFENTRFPVVFTMLALAGLAFGTFWRKKILLGTWFLSFFVLYILFYAGSVNAGVDVRFTLSFYVPVAILAGCGAFLISKTLNKLIKKQVISIAIVSVIIILAFIPFYGFVNSIGTEASDARLSHDFLVDEMKKLEDDAWIFSYVPSIALLNGKNSAYSNLVYNSSAVNYIFSKTDNVYFYQDYWCAWKNSSYSYVNATFHKYFDIEVINTTHHSIRNIDFTLYKIKLK